MLRFELSEYRERLFRTKQKMADAEVEVLLEPDPANMYYLTGYDGWSFYVPQVVVVVLDEDEPIWIGRRMDANGARATTYLNDANIYAYSDVYVHADALHPMDYIASVLLERSLDKRRIGVNMDAEYLSPKALAVLHRNLPDADIIDSDYLVAWVRSVKSERELEYMHQAARITERVMQTAVDVIEPGVRQCDAVAEIYRAQISGTAEYGGDYPAIAPLLPTGLGTSTPHLTWTDDPFVQGETSILELAACRFRYHIPMARTVHLGKPPMRLLDTAEIVVEGLNAALDTVKPGVTCEEVERAWQESIQKHGLMKESRLGYSIGLNYPPDWGEHTMSFRPGNKTVLEPNMCFHCIPGLWLQDWGIEISEALRVTETGCETFADFPRRLIVKD